MVISTIHITATVEAKARLVRVRLGARGIHHSKMYSLLQENRHGFGDGGLVDVLNCDTWHLQS